MLLRVCDRYDIVIIQLGGINTHEVEYRRFLLCGQVLSKCQIWLVVRRDLYIVILIDLGCPGFIFCIRIRLDLYICDRL